MPSGRTLDLADVIGTTLSIYFRNISTLVGAGLVLALPLQACELGMSIVARRQLAADMQHAVAHRDLLTGILGIGTTYGLSLLSIVIASVFYYIGQGVGGVCALRHLAGRRSSVGDLYAPSARNASAVLYLAVLFACASIGSMVTLGLTQMLFASISAVAFPALLSENIGGTAALHRSIFLSRGSRGAIFGSIMVSAIVLCTLIVLAKLPVFLLKQEAMRDNLFGPVRLGSYAMSMFVHTICLPLNGVMFGVMYARLREYQENAKPDKICANI